MSDDSYSFDFMSIVYSIKKRTEFLIHVVIIVCISIWFKFSTKASNDIFGCVGTLPVVPPEVALFYEWMLCLHAHGYPQSWVKTSLS